MVDAQFETSAPSVERCPAPGLPEIAVAGRSNVGKSSLLNALCGRKGLARVSRTPGRTQLLNFFVVDLVGPGAQRRTLRLVDLPGYGYAAARKEIREGFAPMIGGYLTERPTLRGLILLTDIRRGLTELDEAMTQFVMDRELPTVLVATKADKLGVSARGKARRAIADAVGVRSSDVRMTSSQSGLGLRGAESLVEDLATLVQSDAGPVVDDAAGEAS